MRRTTVKIPEELDSRLRNEAKRRGATISEVTRQALEAHLGGGGRRREASHRLSFTGLGRSEHGDLSTRIEEILRGEYDPSGS